jgi:hypothetical protein
MEAGLVQKTSKSSFMGVITGIINRKLLYCRLKILLKEVLKTLQLQLIIKMPQV